MTRNISFENTTLFILRFNVPSILPSLPAIILCAASSQLFILAGRAWPETTYLASALNAQWIVEKYGSVTLHRGSSPLPCIRRIHCMVRTWRYSELNEKKLHMVQPHWEGHFPYGLPLMTDVTLRLDSASWLRLWNTFLRCSVTF